MEVDETLLQGIYENPWESLHVYNNWKPKYTNDPLQASMEIDDTLPREISENQWEFTNAYKNDEWL